MSCLDEVVQLSDGAKIHVKLLGGGRENVRDGDSNHNNNNNNNNNNPTGKPLLITFHGAPGVSDHREPLRSYSFLTERYRVLVYDARGSGMSDLKPPYTHERWIADIEELREWVGVDKVALAGASYGGFIALDYALAHPDRVTMLLLRDTWAYGQNGLMTALKNVLSSSRIQVDRDRQVRAWSGNLHDDKDCQEAFHEIEPIYTSLEAEAKKKSEGKIQRTQRSFHFETHNAAIGRAQPTFDVRARLNEIKAPTLIIVGRHDPITPLSFSVEISQGITNSVLEIFDHSSHSPADDEPIEYQKRVWAFLNSIEKPAV